MKQNQNLVRRCEKDVTTGEKKVKQEDKEDEGANMEGNKVPVKSEKELQADVKTEPELTIEEVESQINESQLLRFRHLLKTFGTNNSYAPLKLLQQITLESKSLLDAQAKCAMEIADKIEQACTKLG